MEGNQKSTDASNLWRTAMTGVLKMQLVLAVLIFLPAGTIRFWQGWLFWLVFLALVLWITLYFLKYDPHLIAGRVEGGPQAEREKSQKIIQTVAGTLAIALVIVPGLDYRFHGSSVPAAIVLMADALVVISFAIVFIVFRENSFAAGTIKVEAEQRVISTGPYRYVRHPMYAGAGLAILATPLALGSIWGVLIGIALNAVIVVRLLDEERYLAANLPDYETYRREVSYRLIPLVW
ncbi:MAG TPA: isoprenylcysteine carboxylmethyltransferase family protein [Candidatus Binataceae bacterium]|nr:isoprenylcysteine carboxylmethyltransferase family protein [Candidatus Binataceae bacterium]